MSGSQIEALRKRYSGAYWDKRSADERRLAGRVARLLYHYFDKDKEAAMLADFKEVARILAKHGIQMKLDDVFWRTIGSKPETADNTGD